MARKINEAENVFRLFKGNELKNLLQTYENESARLRSAVVCCERQEMSLPNISLENPIRNSITIDVERFNNVL